MSTIKITISTEKTASEEKTVLTDVQETKDDEDIEISTQIKSEIFIKEAKDKKEDVIDKISGLLNIGGSNLDDERSSN